LQQLGLDEGIRPLFGVRVEGLQQQSYHQQQLGET